jgi:hypothetical protein
MKGRDDLEDLGVDERIILRWILIECKCVDCIGLGQDSVQWRILVNTVMDLRVA